MRHARAQMASRAESAARVLAEMGSESSLADLPDLHATTTQRRAEAADAVVEIDLSHDVGSSSRQPSTRLDEASAGRRRSTSHARHKVGMGDEQTKPLTLHTQTV